MEEIEEVQRNPFRRWADEEVVEEKEGLGQDLYTARFTEPGGD